jgi:RNA polymerase sigma factor (TIGR02999 family)
VDESHTTSLLQAAANGDKGAANRLFPLVYEELHAAAEQLFRRERAGHTLQPTALVNEAFVRLIRFPVDARSRSHFIALAARDMRQILVDHARKRDAAKRGGDGVLQRLDGQDILSPGQTVEILALDEILERLARVNEREARVVELKFFGGLTSHEIAEVLGVSERTVRNDWSFAQAWLRRELTKGETH